MKYKIILLSSILTITGCLMQKPVNTAPPPPAIRVAKFDYTPPEMESKDSNKVVLILLKPFYLAEKNSDRRNANDHTIQYLGLSAFTDFREKMATDFEEALTARGYLIKGPYSTEDEIVYTDKRNSDLLISVEIDVNINDDNVKAFYIDKTVFSYPNSYIVRYWNFKGTIILDGKINLVVRAVTKTGFGDKLSVRSVPIDRKEIQVESYYKKYSNEYMYGIIKDDPGLYNPLINELENYYKVVFNKAWNYIDPQEFKEYKRLAQEIRGK